MSDVHPLQNTAGPIVAISSSPGRSVRGIVRVGGDDLQRWLGDRLRPWPEPRRLTPAHLAQGAGRPPVPVLALRFAAPASFTGQDMLEIQLPGHPVLLQRIVDGLLVALSPAGGREAEAGEFTRRAFASGRIDLTRAEGIAATIGARCDAQLRAAARLRTGALGRWAEAEVDRLGQLLALVEAGIDFVDQDDVVPIGPGDLFEGLRRCRAAAADLLAGCRRWSEIDAAPRVVLLGPPNVGKSTLFNALLGRPRAVTSALSGTTRDVLIEPMRLPGSAAGEVLLVDAAGVEAAVNPLGRGMQQALAEALQQAELVLQVDDGRAEVEVASGPPGAAPTLRVRTKIDLPGGRPPAPQALGVSAPTGEGLEALREAVAERLGERAVSLASETMVLQDRHRRALEMAVRLLDEALRLLEPHRDGATLDAPELVAEPMRAALTHLGAVGGELSPDDVIGKVFATFCVGK